MISEPVIKEVYIDRFKPLPSEVFKKNIPIVNNKMTWLNMLIEFETQLNLCNKDKELIEQIMNIGGSDE